MITHEKWNDNKLLKPLNNAQLIEVYELAKELNLSIDFQQMLANAIHIRRTEKLYIGH
ncbi:Sporulation inhibitor A [compost metagenome]